MIVCVFGFSAFAADTAKIAVVDIQRVVSLSNYGKEAQAEIQQKGTRN